MIVKLTLKQLNSLPIIFEKEVLHQRFINPPINICVNIRGEDKSYVCLKNHFHDKTASVETVFYDQEEERFTHLFHIIKSKFVKDFYKKQTLRNGN